MKEQIERGGGSFRIFRRGKPIADGKRFTEMILGDSRAEETREGVFFVWGTKGCGPRRQRARGFQGGESREFVGGRSHLGTQAVENRERRFFSARVFWTSRWCVRKSGSEKPIPPG